MESNKYLNKISSLLRNNEERLDKYLRNYRLYTGSPIASLEDANTVVGYDPYAQSNIEENIIYSTISTLVSKIASQKARPFVNTINGNFKDINNAKATQQFFDVYYDEENISTKISMAFQDACIFDTGALFLNPETCKIEKVSPWRVFVNPIEAQYNSVTQVVYRCEKYPLHLIESYDGDSDRDYVTYIRYWNIKDHKFVEWIKEFRWYKESDYESEAIPFLFVHYEIPQMGNTCCSIVDRIKGIQRKVDLLLKKMSEAIDSSTAMIYMVPNNTDIKTSKFTNKTGQVVSYTPTPNMTSNPVAVLTPPIIDAQYRTLLEEFKEDAMEQIGISQLSSMGKKPSGLDSGTALSTMENIEADRFQTQVNQVVRLYSDLARLILKVFPSNSDILPNDRYRLSIKWGDIVKSKDKMSIQFSSADSLSKDPETKYKLLKEMCADGFIPASRISGLMQMPDLELGYSFAANDINAINTVINNAIENEDYNIPSYISIESLKPEITNTCRMLSAANSKENKKFIERLEKLYQAALQKQTEIGEAQREDEASETLDNEANDLDYKSMQMDMQNEQLTSLAEDLQNGVITQEEAQAQVDSLGQLSLF